MILVLFVTLHEFWRAARARQKAQNENFFAALARLIGRNRRRYGGYIIHISMMLMAIGILGIEIFQKETQGTVPVDGSLSSRRLYIFNMTISPVSWVRPTRR